MKNIAVSFAKIITFLLPGKAKIFMLNKLFNCEIDLSAKIGLSYIDVKKIKMGKMARIGNFNIIKNLEILDLRDYASIGSRNYISSLPLGSTRNFQSELDRTPVLALGEHASITGKHYFDCNNMISIGKYSLVAGIGTTFLTHGIDIVENRQRTAKIVIGDYCMVGANSTLVKGSKLPSCSVLAAGSTLHKAYEETYCLYSGVPANPVKTLSKDSKFFNRAMGFVS